MASYGWTRDVRFCISVLRKFLEFDKSRPNIESLAFLIGYVANDVLVISDCFIGEQSASGAHVSANEEMLIQAVIAIENRSEDIVGWIHSHPGMGAHFFSQTDTRTQLLFQSQFPAAIGVVVDGNKFFQNGNIKDLDVHIFRVTNEKPYVDVPFKYEIDELPLLSGFTDISEYPPLGIPIEASEVSKILSMLNIESSASDLVESLSNLSSLLPDPQKSAHDSVLQLAELKFSSLQSSLEAESYKEYDNKSTQIFGYSIFALSFLANILLFFFFVL